MKKHIAILMSVLLLAFAYSSNLEDVSALKPTQEEKMLKELEKHTEKIKVVKEIVTGGLDQDDEINDIYLKIKNPGKSSKAIKVDFKIKDTCVNGITYEEATMKMAFSEGPLLLQFLTDEGFEVTNKWFKKNDDNK